MVLDLNIVFTFFGDYGWYLVLLSALFLFIYNKYSSHVERYIRQRKDAAYSAKYHKDSNLYESRISEQQSYIQKLQDKYQQDVELHQQKLKEKEDRKRQELLVQLEHPSGSGKCLGNSSTSSKPEYNPLMGETSRSYRPAKKTCGGGGCGR